MNRLMNALFGAEIRQLVNEAVASDRAEAAELYPLLIKAAGGKTEAVDAGFSQMAGVAVTTANSAEDEADTLLTQALEKAQVAASARREVDALGRAVKRFGYTPLAAQAGRAKRNWGRVMQA